MSLHLRSLAVLLAAILIVSPALLAEHDPPGFADQIDEMFADWNRSDSPGVAVAVVRDREIFYAKAFGMADLERRVALTPQSVFEIGSVSKQFTAMSILLLELDGRLSLDDDIRTYLPEMPVYEEPITLRHLLHHTSGIRDIETLFPLAGWPYENYYSEAQQLDLISRQRALNFPPGEQHLYSNSGYVLLASIVRRVTGQTLREFAEERIFRPLGMRHTVFYDTPTQIIEDRAIPYSRGDDGRWRMELWYLPFAGPSGLYTNIEDLARWDANFYDNRLGGGAELIAKMESRGILDDGKPIDYAMGLFITDHRDRRVVAHGGAWMGFRADLTRFPDDRLTVILLSNASSTGVSSRRIADLYLGAGANSGAVSPSSSGALETVEVYPTDLTRFEGTFWNESGLLLRRIEVREGALYYVRSEQSASPLGPLGDGRFVMLEVDARVRVVFEPDRGGGDRAMIVTVDDDEPLEFRKLDPAPGASLVEYEGRYRSEELERDLQVLIEGGEVSITWIDEPRPAPSIALARDDLLVQHFVAVPWYPQDVRLRFARDDTGVITGLSLTCDMVRGITFSRLDP